MVHPAAALITDIHACRMSDVFQIGEIFDLRLAVPGGRRLRRRIARRLLLLISCHS